MKILVTIPHYYNATNNNIHGSGGKNPLPRIHALSACLFNLHSIIGNSQTIIDIFNKEAIKSNQKTANEIDIIICTTEDKHLLNQIKLPAYFFKNHQCQLDNPKNLGFECQKILKENLGKYDYYCFMEDDLIIHDPLFFEKTKWFNNETESTTLLQPNRYEVSASGNVLKSYVDGDIRPAATKIFQNVNKIPEINKEFLGQNYIFKRPYNPHSGCYFLSQKQMEYWASQPHFLDMDASFISPLESSATLGIMKTFKIYKPAVQNANFLEIQHFGDQFLRLIGNQIKYSAENH